MTRREQLTELLKDFHDYPILVDQIMDIMKTKVNGKLVHEISPDANHRLLEYDDKGKVVRKTKWLSSGDLAILFPYVGHMDTSHLFHDFPQIFVIKPIEGETVAVESYNPLDQ